MNFYFIVCCVGKSLLKFVQAFQIHPIYIQYRIFVAPPTIKPYVEALLLGCKLTVSLTYAKPLQLGILRSRFRVSVWKSAITTLNFLVILFSGCRQVLIQYPSCNMVTVFPSSVLHSQHNPITVIVNSNTTRGIMYSGALSCPILCDRQIPLASGLIKCLKYIHNFKTYSEYERARVT
jgi:hypothetical protein